MPDTTFPKIPKNYSKFSSVLGSILRSKLFQILTILLILVLIIFSIFTVLVAQKSGQFLQTKDLYSNLEIFDKEKQRLSQNKPWQSFENTENSQIVDSDKCNLQIKMPKNFRYSSENSGFFPSISPVYKDKMSSNGEKINILPDFKKEDYEDLTIICSDKTTMLGIFENRESESVKAQKKLLEHITFYNSVYKEKIYSQENEEKLLKEAVPYKFYKLDQKQLQEITNWEIGNSKLENIKMIESLNLHDKKNMQIRNFDLYFTHKNQGYWLNLAISKNLNEAEMLEALKNFEKTEGWKPSFDYQKDKIEGIFGNQINLRFKN